jgi:hypothetical protein
MEGSGPSREFSFALNTSLARSGVDVRDYDTPRDDVSAGSPLGVGLPAPASPNSVRKKTKSRAGKALNRHDSLKESKASSWHTDHSDLFIYFFIQHRIHLTLTFNHIYLAGIISDRNEEV